MLRGRVRRADVGTAPAASASEEEEEVVAAAAVSDEGGFSDALDRRRMRMLGRRFEFRLAGRDSPEGPDAWERTDWREGCGRRLVAASK